MLSIGFVSGIFEHLLLEKGHAGDESHQYGDRERDNNQPEWRSQGYCKDMQPPPEEGFAEVVWVPTVFP